MAGTFAERLLEMRRQKDVAGLQQMQSMLQMAEGLQALKRRNAEYAEQQEYKGWATKNSPALLTALQKGEDLPPDMIANAPVKAFDMLATTQGSVNALKHQVLTDKTAAEEREYRRGRDKISDAEAADTRRRLWAQEERLGRQARIDNTPTSFADAWAVARAGGPPKMSDAAVKHLQENTRVGAAGVANRRQLGYNFTGKGPTLDTPVSSGGRVSVSPKGFSASADVEVGWDTSIGGIAQQITAAKEAPYLKDALRDAYGKVKMTLEALDRNNVDDDKWYGNDDIRASFVGPKTQHAGFALGVDNATGDILVPIADMVYRVTPSELPALYLALDQATQP